MAKDEYEGDFKITILLAKSLDCGRYVTRTFTPFCGKILDFGFNARYSNFGFCTFSLKLVKRSIATTPPISVLVWVNYSDGSLFTQYPRMEFNDKIDYIKFKDVSKPGKSSIVEHARKMKSNTLIIKCKMTLLDQDQTADTGTKLLELTNISRNPKPCKCVDVIGNLKSMYEQSVLSDFVFKVGEKSFHAHKNILAAHSPVFMTMMTHDFMESKTNSVTITDATPEIFDLFLKSLYAGELENTAWDSLKELYYLVDKYDVGFLKVECTVAAISVLSVDLICEILKLAYKFSDSGLKTDAINFAVKHFKEIVPREDWKELLKTHPMIGYDVTVNFAPK